MNRNTERDSGSGMSARPFRKRCFGQMFLSLPNRLPCGYDVLELGSGSRLLLTGSIAEASPSRSGTELSEPSNELVEDRKRVRRETSYNSLPYIKQNAVKLKETSLLVNDLIRLENLNTAPLYFVRSMDKISDDKAPSPASTADVTSSRDVTSLAERTDAAAAAAVRNVAIDKKRAKLNAVVPTIPVATTARRDLQTPDSTTSQSYRELTTNLRQLEHEKELRCSAYDSVIFKNSFHSSTAGAGQGGDSFCRNYWLRTTLPPTDQLFVEPHWTNIGHVVSVYDDFRRNITTILRGERTPAAAHSERLRFEKRKLKFEANTTMTTSSFPTPPPPSPRGTSAAAEVCDAYRRFYHRLCVNSQGFQSLDRSDQQVILDYGQSASVALVAAGHLHPSEADVYRRHLENHLEIRGPALDSHCRRLSELSHRLRALEVDLIEESLLNSLLLIAADYPNLSRPDYIEKVRYSLLKTFQAYITAKSDSSSSRLRHLLYFGPKIREIGSELRNLMKQVVSLSRNQKEKKIADSSSSKRFCVTLEENLNDTVPDSTSSEANKTQRRYSSEEFPSYCSNRELLPQNNENDSSRKAIKDRQLSFREDLTKTWKNRTHAIITVF